MNPILCYNKLVFLGFELAISKQGKPIVTIKQKYTKQNKTPILQGTLGEMDNPWNIHHPERVKTSDEEWHGTECCKSSTTPIPSSLFTLHSMHFLPHT